MIIMVHWKWIFLEWSVIFYLLRNSFQRLISIAPGKLLEGLHFFEKMLDHWFWSEFLKMLYCWLVKFSRWIYCLCESKISHEFPLWRSFALYCICDLSAVFVIGDDIVCDVDFISSSFFRKLLIPFRVCFSRLFLVESVKSCFILQTFKSCFIFKCICILLSRWCDVKHYFIEGYEKLHNF